MSNDQGDALRYLKSTAWIAAVLFGLAAASTAAAQGRKVLLLEDVTIEGEVQKPTVTLFVSRQNLNTDATLELRESFVPRIVESVEKRPF